MARPNPSSIRRIFQHKAKQENGSSREKSKGFGISLPVLGILGLVFLCAVIWAFVMGFLVGRGHNPEAHLREMTGFTASETETIQEQPHESAETVEDLNSGEVARSQEEQTDSKDKTAISFPEPSEAALAAWGEQRPAKSEKPKPVKKSEPGSANGENLQRYEYSFQIGAFKSAADAEKVKKQIQSRSMPVEVRKSGKVFLALTKFRGTDRTEQDLLAKMKALKLGKPLRLARKKLDNATRVKGKR